MTKSHNARHDAIRLTAAEAEQHVREAVDLLAHARSLPLRWSELPDSWDMDFLTLASALESVLPDFARLHDQIAERKEDDRV